MPICIILELVKKVVLYVSLVVITLANIVVPAGAVPSDNVIRANCQSIQSVLSQIEKTDAALRINRGRIYNEVLDLFYAMNSRLASNKISAPELVSITSDFDSQLADFRNDYNDYDDDLNELIVSECQDDPGDFYSQLISVRDERAKLNDEIASLDQLVDDYWTEFNDNVRSVVDGN